MNMFTPPPPPQNTAPNCSPRSGSLKTEGFCEAKTEGFCEAKTEGFCEAKTETPFLRSKSPKAATGLKPTQQRKPFGRGSRFSRAAETLRTLTLSALLALPAASALAQSQTFHEIHHPHGRLNPNNQGGSSYQGRVIHIPDQEWINYHGALAWGRRSGEVGSSENARSLDAARREALRKCDARACEIAAYATNGCLAAAFDGGGNTVGAAATKEEAEQRAMNHCQADGSTTCRITYSHCNHPVRIR